MKTWTSITRKVTTIILSSLVIGIGLAVLYFGYERNVKFFAL
jgi:hypothetical protein